MDDWIDRLYNLRRDKKGSHEKPHKPVLLLTAIDLIQRGLIERNEIPLSEELIDRYRELFDVVRSAQDKPNPHLPLYHLSGDKFWYLISQPGQGPVYQEGNAAAPKSLKRLREEVQWAEFDGDLWDLLSVTSTRNAIRDALISRYFAGARKPLLDLLCVEPAPLQVQEAPAQDYGPARDAAFRRTIRDIYDYRCAACGIRVLLDAERRHVLIEAAHLIPWEKSHNDNPTNGMALCRNHHWALDEYLIAPCPSKEHPAGIWRVSPALDDRIADLKSFVRLQNRRVIRPRESKFLPSQESLEWRESHLLS